MFPLDTVELTVVFKRDIEHTDVLCCFPIGTSRNDGSTSVDIFNETAEVQEAQFQFLVIHIQQYIVAITFHCLHVAQCIPVYP